VCTYTKTAGIDTIVVTSDADNATGAGCVYGYDQYVRTDYVTVYQNMGEYNIPCTGYKLRQRHTVPTSDVCNGGGRAVPFIQNITADLMPR
jgi:hypothetical protein